MTIQLRSHISSTENSALRTEQYFPIISHNIKTSADVGATFHIEPNHNPRAREPALAWFALTRQGGQLIPLEQCDCQLVVYSKSSSDQGNSPILEPQLKAISAEKYLGIPGADLVFPKAGVYELVLSGTPKSGASFKPFEIKYDVTVTPGKKLRLCQVLPLNLNLTSTQNPFQNPSRILHHQSLNYYSGGCP
ncbi:hypothetical protein LYNGBM3L_12900 [Moorena producens 3L]|uniref:Uncharacterized protein n=1 Tax=Moorena producens 3L TaxID=489825 RepID=F4XKZ1_9CYAN|nr:hypothetical protein [Moorena producens]EGJ34681.1 hypothetical protein LYNGBM3L_12900 [Moorena producens 3L]OLT65855.1 hypothetical protein BI334_13160 [Moorena producens 3L]